MYISLTVYLLRSQGINSLNIVQNQFTLLKSTSFRVNITQLIIRVQQNLIKVNLLKNFKNQKKLHTQNWDRFQIAFQGSLVNENTRFLLIWNLFQLVNSFQKEKSILEIICLGEFGWEVAYLTYILPCIQIFERIKLIIDCSILGVIV